MPGFFRFLDVDKNGKLTEKEWGKIVKWVGGFKHENALLAIRPGDGGERKPKIVWKQHAGVPECLSPVVGDGKIFAASARGIVTVFEAGDSLNTRQE